MNTLPLQTACRPRFFSLTDTKKIKGPHHEYGQAVQQYFHRLFPHRRWQVFRDPIGTPLSVDVEILYPTEEEPFYLLHTMGMSAAPMRAIRQVPLRRRTKVTVNCVSSCRLAGLFGESGVCH